MDSSYSQFHSVLTAQCYCFDVFASVKGHCSVYDLCVYHKLLLFSLIFIYRRNGQNFGRVFLMLNYTDITQNIYIQS